MVDHASWTSEEPKGRYLCPFSATRVPCGAAFLIGELDPLRHVAVDVDGDVPINDHVAQNGVDVGIISATAGSPIVDGNIQTVSRYDPGSMRRFLTFLALKSAGGHSIVPMQEENGPSGAPAYVTSSVLSTVWPGLSMVYGSSHRPCRRTAIVLAPVLFAVSF